MGHAIGAPEAAHACLVQRGKRVGRDEGMGHRHIDRGGARLQQQARGLRQGMASAGHIVEQHHGPALHVQRRQCDGDAAVAMALFGAHGMLQPVALCGLGHPLGRFAIRAHQQRARALLHDPVGQQRCTADHHGLGCGYSLGQRGNAVQVRIDGDHSVKQAGQERADDALAHGFAGMESDVLAHVSQVRRHQREVAHAQGTRGAGGQQQFNQLVVGLVEAAQQHGAHGQLARPVHRQSQFELAIRKAMALHGPQGQAAGGGQALGSRAFVVEVQQTGLGCRQSGHVQNST